MSLNSDAQGFLIGSPVDLGGLREEMRGLRRDVQSIRQALRDRKNHESSAPAVTAPKLSAAPSESVQPSARRRAIAEVSPILSRPVAERSRSPRREVTEDPSRASESDDSNSRWSSGPGVTGRVAAASAEVAKSVVNEEADASVKAFNEVAEPLKRGWNALRGDRGEKRQEGWLKKIFGALRGEGSGASGAGAGLLRRWFGGRDTEGGESRFDKARSRAAAGVDVGDDYAEVSGGRRDSGREISLHNIEHYLKSLDHKVHKPKEEGFLMSILPLFTKFIPAVVEFLRQRRMDSNLDKIRKITDEQLKVSKPFFAYARKRLKEMGEEEDGESKGAGGLFATIIAATLGALFAKLAGLLSGVPVLGKMVAGLARMLGGRVPPIIPRGAARAAAAGSGALVPAGAAKAVSRWGKTAEGLRGNRLARTGRVAMRNAGRFMRPAGRLLKRVPVLGSLLALGIGVAGSSGIEKDETKTREQKNAAQGKNWGSVGGGLGGAALGAALGSIVPGLGTIIGGIIGGVLGEWLGGNLGEEIGTRFSGWMQTLTPIFQEIKIWALATWDWIRDGATAFYDGAKEVFAGVGDWIGEKWGELVDLGRSVFDRFASVITSLYDGLRNSKIFGPLIKAAEATAAAAASMAKAAAEKAKEVASSAAEGATQLAGKVWDGTKEGLKSMIPKGVKDRAAHERALFTAADYRAGNIGGLDDAHTRELVASTALTESSGGDLDARNLNGKGYAGRYQAGASWLADAGLIKGGAGSVQAAMKADGFDPKASGAEWKWAVGGGMDHFLRNNANWNNGLSLQKYMASADIQDAAFKTNSDAAYQSLLKSGAIKPGDSQEHIAGLLKARHISGMAGARAVAKGGDSRADANGTSARNYYNDLAGPNRRFGSVFDKTASPVTVGAQPVSVAPAAPVSVAPKAPAPPPSPVSPAIPDAPQAQVPLGSGPAAKPLVVQMPSQDAGQDVRDRGIAHIATGGYARA